MAPAGFTLDNPVFRAFLGYAGVVLVKTLFMAPITAFHRFTKKAFVNEEDAASALRDKKRTVTNNPDVERVRRAHLNDLENVVPFVLLGLLYIGTGPSLSSALLHFRIFTVARVLHTVVYLFKVPQPSRALCFVAGLIVCLSMGYQVVTRGSF